MSPVLQAEGACAGYGAIPVVRDVDLAVEPGEIVALLGPNGAGKTTTLLTLAGILTPSAGVVRFAGGRSRAPLHRRARSGLAYVSEERSVFMGLTTAENLRVARCDSRAALELFPELASRLNVKAGLLSGGEQQMLALARALTRAPRVLLADELSLGLAPLVVDRLHVAVREAARERGVGVVLVEQHVRKVLRFADRVHVMHRGRITRAGSGAEFRAHPELIEESYLTSEPAPLRPVG